MSNDMAPPLGFVGGTLDRADQVRVDPEQFARAFADPRARRVMLDGLDPVIVGDRLATEPLPAVAAAIEHLLLGIGDDGPLFVRLSGAASAPGRPSPRIWEAAGLLTADQLALYGTARSLVDWHARHRFCSTCGSGTVVHKGGWARKCTQDAHVECGAEHFPRVDPVTIMLAEHDGRVLVGRQHAWPPGRFSALAGFVEPGETIEEAVARELWEEAGIRVSEVRYVMSQPWPFPSSLMIACMARAVDDVLTIDETEIEAAMWVDADTVRAAMAGGEDAPFGAPPPMAVAHHLFLHWLGQR